MRNTFPILAGLYAVSFVPLFVIDVDSRPPWKFVLSVVFLYLPFAFLATESLLAVERHVERRRWLGPTFGIPIAILLIAIDTLALSFHQIRILFMVTFFVLVVRFRRRLLAPLFAGAVALFLVYAFAWNLNNLVGHLALDRLQDPVVLDIDLFFYGILFGGTVDPQGLYPLTASPLFFAIMECCYGFLYMQVFIVVLVRARRHASLAPFILQLTAAYAIAMIVFYLYPVVGPFIYPETRAASFHDSRSFLLMTEMNQAYEALRTAGDSRGLCYVVGLPSMHVTTAILVQKHVALSRAHFWALLPISILTAISTFYLGFHYVADAIAGALLAALLLGAEVWWSRLRATRIDPEKAELLSVAARS